MKKILIALLMVGLMGFTAFGLIRFCTETDGSDAFCIGDDNYLHFGTDRDVSICYLSDVWTFTGDLTLIGALTYTGNLAITGNLSSDGALVSLDGSTSAKLLSLGYVDIESKDIRFGLNAADYMKFTTTITSGNLAITHSKSSKVTWTAGGGFDFAGAIEVDALTGVGTLDITGNVDLDAPATVLIDGVTSVRNVSAGFVSLEGPAVRFGANATEYMSIAVTETTGAVAITHTGNNKKVTWTTTGGFDFAGDIEVDAVTAAGNMGVTGNIDVNGTLASLDGSTSAKLISAALIGVEAPDIRLGFDDSYYMKIAVAETSSDVAITHVGGSDPDVTWASTSLTYTGVFEVEGASTFDAITGAGNLSIAGTTALIDGSTSARLVSATLASIEAANVRLGVSDTIYMDFAVAAVSGDVAITHTGDNPPDITWTAGSLSFVGDFDVNGDVASIDGETTVDLISAGHIDIESGDIRLGLDGTYYMKLVTVTSSGNLTITHPDKTPAVSWTADSFDFVGTMAIDATSISDALTFSDDATIDNSDATTLTLTETNIELAGVVAVAADIDIGSSGTVGSLDLFPVTGSMGKLNFLAANSAADHTTTITNASQAGARTFTIPDAGASAYFVMSTGAANTAGQIDREDLSTDDLVVFGVPLTSIVDHDGAAMAAAAAAGRFGRLSGGYGTGTLTLDGEAASAASKTSTCMFEFILPVGYQASGDVNLVVTAYESVGAATASTTLTAEVYENDGDGTVSADLDGGFVPGDIIDSWQTCTSVITDADLTAGDRLIVFIQIVCNDTGGSVGTIAQIGKVEMRCDVKG